MCLVKLHNTGLAPAIPCQLAWRTTNAALLTNRTLRRTSPNSAAPNSCCAHVALHSPAPTSSRGRNSTSGTPRSVRQAGSNYPGRDPGFPGPPGQIHTCALTHVAPRSGRTVVLDGESYSGPWVSDLQLWPMSRSELIQRLPRCTAPLGSSS